MRRLRHCFPFPSPKRLSSTFRCSRLCFPSLFSAIAQPNGSFNLIFISKQLMKNTWSHHGPAKKAATHVCRAHNFWRYCVVTYIIKCQICLTQFNRSPETPATHLATRQRWRTLGLSGRRRWVALGREPEPGLERLQYRSMGLRQRRRCGRRGR